VSLRGGAWAPGPAVADTIKLTEFRHPTHLHDAWQRWEGFVALAPAEHALSPKLCLTPGSSRDPLQFAEDHGRTGAVDPLGCYFLQNVTFAGMLYPFRNDRLLDDRSHLARVSAAWLDTYPQHRPGSRDNRGPVTITGPVIAVAGPGHRTYGHWIIDFLPRLAVARDLLGRRFDDVRFLLLADTPAWARALLQSIFGIGAHRIIDFEFARDEFVCEQLCYPTFCHNYPFYLHSFVARFYRSMSHGLVGKRRLCVRRPSTPSGRSFKRRAEFERRAEVEGYELVDPQDLTFDQQIELFRSAAVVIGEYGSGLHNSVFSASTTVFGVLNAPGVEQTRLCAVMGQPIVYAIGDVEGGEWTLTDGQFDTFFDLMRDLPKPPPNAPSPAALADALAHGTWYPSHAVASPEAGMRFRQDGVVDGGAFAGAAWSLRDGQVLVAVADLEQPGSRGGTAVGAFTSGHDAVRNPHDVAFCAGRFCTIGSHVTLSGPGRDAALVSTAIGPASATRADPSTTAVVLGNDVRIEDGATLVAGIVIGDGAIIRSGAVVSQDVPAYAIVAGNPASVTAMRFGPEQVSRLIALRWWDLPAGKMEALRPWLASADVDGFISAASVLIA
jgi:hypothetical protein